MAVIRIDDKLYKKIIKFIKGEKRFDFPSVKAFVDKAIYEKIKELEKLDKRIRKRKYKNLSKF